MWEILTYGQIPYATKNNTEVLDMLLSGQRMTKPSECPDKLYDIMKQCWSLDVKDRPNFDEILSQLSPFQAPKKKQTLSNKDGNVYNLTPLKSPTDYTFTAHM